MENLGPMTIYKPMACFEKLIEIIHELNAICKKRKQKKLRNESFKWKKSFGK